AGQARCGKADALDRQYAGRSLRPHAARERRGWEEACAVGGCGAIFGHRRLRFAAGLLPWKARPAALLGGRSAPQQRADLRDGHEGAPADLDWPEVSGFDELVSRRAANAEHLAGLLDG